MPSITDLYPKTDLCQTTLNTIKGFIGLGILAGP
jgi:amino acid permease